MVEFVQATQEHLSELARTMRPEDVQEVVSLGDTPQRALEESYQRSILVHAALIDGEVAAVWGIVPWEGATGQIANVWMLSGGVVNRRKRAFLQGSRKVLGGLLSMYPVLVAYIGAEHQKAIRWARWLGMEVRRPVPMGNRGALFHTAIARRNRWASE